MLHKISLFFWISTNFVNFVNGATNLKSSTATPTSTPSESNVSYGPNPSQVLDYYLPNGTNASQAIILIHGGAWGGGAKFDMSSHVPFLRNSFPQCLIVNMEYRLGTWGSPGYPKQLQDIGLAIKHIKSKVASVQRFALLGGSAGGHLALLYAYKYDRKERDVAVVVDVVGPTDFTDAAYAFIPVYNFFLFTFVGPNLFLLNPRIYAETSPVTYVTRGSPKTIGFYGDVDILVPPSQAARLKGKLDKTGVVNQFTIYSGGHYFDWSDKDKKDMQDKIVSFLRDHF